MASGVGVDQLCLTTFNELKLKKQHRYVIYKISDDHSTIEVEKKTEASKTAQNQAAFQEAYQAFLKDLPMDDCRYAVYDFSYEIPGEGIRSKLLFYTW